ncbi:hypothetical protein JHK87_052563 [Glycine soja]|nr:hypothetical protein JHK87_052563 [Glycine soja]
MLQLSHSESLIGKRKEEEALHVALSVILTAAGVLIAALGDFSFDLFGYSMAFTLYLVLVEKSGAEDELSSLEIMFYNSFLSLPFFMFLIIATGEFPNSLSVLFAKADMKVRDKILILLDSWQEAFGGPGGKHSHYYWAYEELKVRLLRWCLHQQVLEGQHSKTVLTSALSLKGSILRRCLHQHVLEGQHSKTVLTSALSLKDGVAFGRSLKTPTSKMVIVAPSLKVLTFHDVGIYDGHPPLL